jgi:hypothetical protein
MRGTIFMHRPLHLNQDDMKDFIPFLVLFVFLPLMPTLTPFEKKVLTQNSLTIIMHRPLHLNQDDMMDFIPFLMLFVFLPPMPKLTPFKKKASHKIIEISHRSVAANLKN